MNSPSEPNLDQDQVVKIYLLPNTLTALNLLCGFIAIIRCIQAHYAVGVNPSALYNEAVLWILGAMVCDSLDGRLARLGGRESLFGKEFDSIVDMVSFGVAPALMVLFHILSPDEIEFFRRIGGLLAFVYLLCAGVRLARFNIITNPHLFPEPEEPPTKDFIGLPVPAAAGMIATLVLLINKHDLQRWAIALPFLMVFISYLMVSPIRYPSFKEVDWNTKVRIRTFVLLLAAVAFVYVFREYALVGLFLSYLFYGVIRYWRANKKERATDPEIDIEV